MENPNNQDVDDVEVLLKPRKLIDREANVQLWSRFHVTGFNLSEFLVDNSLLEGNNVYFLKPHDSAFIKAGTVHMSQLCIYEPHMFRKKKT